MVANIIIISQVKKKTNWSADGYRDLPDMGQVAEQE